MSIQDKCLKLYESGGQWAVIDYCDSILWKYWAECPLCECRVPVDTEDGSCLVCSHALDVNFEKEVVCELKDKELIKKVFSLISKAEDNKVI